MQCTSTDLEVALMHAGTLSSMMPCQCPWLLHCRGSYFLVSL
jgi:hypothetical protein